MLGTAVPPLLKQIRRLATVTSSDEQLLADFVARQSNEAFSALIGRHGPMVFNLCRRILHDAHAAEDVFQATFLVLADRAGAIHQPASLAGFLHGVAYRLAIRARERNMQSLPTDVADNGIGPSDGLLWKEMLGILDKELSKLPERFREPLVLCYLEGRTQDEAARQLGWSLNTLRRRLVQGRRVLEARLRGRGITLSAALAGVLAAGSAAVSGPLRAATLAAVDARMGSNLTVGASVLTASKGGIAFFLSASGKKIGALAALATLCAMFYLAYGSTPPVEQVQAANATPPKVLIPIADAGQEDPKAEALPTSGVVRLGAARYRHGTRIECMAVSADGKLAVTSSGNSPYNAALAGRFSPARVFDLADGRCLYSIPNEHGAYSDYPEAVSLSPDGKTLATRDDKFLSFWDAATGKQLRQFKYLSSAGGGRSPTDWLTFTPDGKHVAVTLMGTAVQLVNVETAKVERTFDMTAAARACVFSSDGKRMATGGYEQEKGVYHAQLWEVATGKEIRRIAIAHENNRAISALAFSHDGIMLAGGARSDGQLRLFEVDTGKELRALPKVGDDIRAIAFSPDGNTVAAAGDRIHLYDPETGKERLQIDRKARTLVFSQDGRVLIGAVSGAIYRWDAANGRQLDPAPGQDSAVEQILVSADGRSLFTTDQDGDLYLWDAAGKKSPRRIASGIDRGVMASADRRFLAWTIPADHGNSRIRLYDVVADRITDPILRSAEGFRAIGGAATVTAFLPDGKSLITLQPGPATFRIWDIESGKEQRSFAAIPPKSVAMHPGAAADEDLDRPVRLWSVATGKAGQELQAPMNVGVPSEAGAGATSYMGFGPRPFCTTRRAALSPDGKTLAIGRDWAATFGNRSMKPMDGRAFSPDGRFLVDWAENPLGSSRMDHVHVWDAATGRAVATLAAGPRAGATSAAFAPDGRTLAAASADGVVRLWEVATWKVRAEFRGHRDRVTAVGFGPDSRLFTGGLDTVVLGWDLRPPGSAAKGTLDEAWNALAHNDAQTGFQAQGRFLADPVQAVEWFAARLSPVIHPNTLRTKAWIADLDKEDFATRAKATANLKEHWPATEASLRESVVKASSLEARRRAEGIVLELEKAITPPGKLRALRAAEVLEWIGTKESRTVLLKLATGAPDSQLTREAAGACKRLDRWK